MVLAIDFDGTLSEDGHFPGVGKPIEKNINYIKKMKEEGHKLILWTCREGMPLKTAIEWCKNFGIEFDAVNESIDIERQMNEFGYNPRKIYADIYLDNNAIRA